MHSVFSLIDRFNGNIALAKLHITSQLGVGCESIVMKTEKREEYETKLPIHYHVVRDFDGFLPLES